jgi:4-amino-4-deoxy-L-arabinose transferase-like glycosyltransferase
MRRTVRATIKLIVAIAVLLAVVGPWLYLVARRESSFLGTGVSHDVFTRIVRPLEGHRGPPGYHLALIFGTFLPWSALLPMAVVSAWQNRRFHPRLRFALAAVLGPWVMFELVQTKLPHYMLPVFPPLAFLAADAIVRCLRGAKDDLRRTSFAVAAGVVGAAVFGLGVAACVASARLDGRPGIAAAAPALAGLAFAVAVVMAFARRRVAAGLLSLGLGMAAVYAVLFGVYLPRADYLSLSRRVAAVLHREGATGPGESVMLDYKEPSLAFYQGGTIRENSASVLSHRLLDAAPRWLVITDEVWQRTPADVRARVEVVRAVRGFAYADGGRVVEVVVVRRR